MREIFRGWKRQLGCVMLVVACVLAGGSARSWFDEDEFALITRQRIHSFGSDSGSLSWWAWDDPVEAAGSARLVEWNTHPIPRDYLRSDPRGGFDSQGVRVLHFSEIDPRRRAFDGQFRLRDAMLVAIANEGNQVSLSGFSGEAQARTNLKKWAIPHWLVFVPLTAISAWLLLSKPRVKNEPSTTPVSENA